jgi:hypothetical protein
MKKDIERFQKLSDEFRKEMGLRSLKEVFLSETNAEDRMKIVKVNGIKKIYEICDAQVVDKKGNYELINLDLGKKEYRPYLKMVNPSTGEYHIEGIHPDCKTVDAAIEWRNGTSAEPSILT